MKGKSKRAAKNNTAVINSKIVPEVKAEPTEEMLLQFGENEVSLTDISAKVKQSYQESDSKEELKDMKVYIKPSYLSDLLCYRSPDSSGLLSR